MKDDKKLDWEKGKFDATIQNAHFYRPWRSDMKMDETNLDWQDENMEWEKRQGWQNHWSPNTKEHIEEGKTESKVLRGRTENIEEGKTKSKVLPDRTEHIENGKTIEQVSPKVERSYEESVV